MLKLVEKSTLPGADCKAYCVIPGMVQILSNQIFGQKERQCRIIEPDEYWRGCYREGQSNTSIDVYQLPSDKSITTNVWSSIVKLTTSAHFQKDYLPVNAMSELCENGHRCE
jgi:hypothetical protein